MLRTLASLGRLGRAGFMLARYDAIFPREYQDKFPPSLKAFAALTRLFSKRGEADNPGERLARALEKLGPTYVKFGQVLATRADVVGERFARGLSRLQDQMPPFDQAVAVTTLERELGGALSASFKSFGEPVNAASVAQVHKAVTTDGQTVAVKILRPGIERRLAKDIRAMRLGAALVQKLVPAAKRLEPVKFVETVARATELETDLRLEAAAASELAEAAAYAENFRVPAVNWERSAKRVLTTEWIDGIPLTDIDGIDKAGIDRDALAVTLTRAFLTCALETGVFHADMHAGNLFADRDGNLWAVDFGIMGRIGKSERRFLAMILHGFLTRDYAGAAQAHFDAGYVPQRHSIEDFASALRAVGEPIFGKRADEVPMSRVLLQLFEITDLFDMHLRPELVLLQKTMVQSEGVARQLNPQHDMWTASAPVVEKWMRRELGPEGVAADFVADVKRLRDSARKLPGAIDDWAEAGARLRSGEVRLDTESLDRLAGRQREGRIWRWLGYGVLAVAAGGAGAALYGLF
ncbi:2-polyprenylphenol 6-hydroxylase [Hyphobacterium sp. HN65]|uniref:2-polyprenylphenol 6-hydroxylase n=1 Tax=Hyphobacterium lacteum TaxID=3116575 RepID=A0ABU7LTQ1_9PROT|nr:2-polyprenylphenol 6-hydroxylase [Hyphobacterium sp. HN65]MEE2526724.1 2-polyprenylphenol 6-hydroxylase [Hyphobacterium sp. HN65]